MNKLKAIKVAAILAIVSSAVLGCGRGQPKALTPTVTLTNYVTVTVTVTNTIYADDKRLAEREASGFDDGTFWGMMATLEGNSKTIGEIQARAYELRKQAKTNYAAIKARIDAAKAP